MNRNPRIAQAMNLTWAAQEAVMHARALPLDSAERVLAEDAAGRLAALMALLADRDSKSEADWRVAE